MNETNELRTICLMCFFLVYAISKYEVSAQRRYRREVRRVIYCHNFLSAVLSVNIAHKCILKKVKAVK